MAKPTQSIFPQAFSQASQLRKRGAGMPVLQGRGRGDLVVEVQVETPTKLSSRQKELLREFRETETGEECPESRGFFDRIKGAFAGDLTPSLAIISSRRSRISALVAHFHGHLPHHTPPEMRRA